MSRFRLQENDENIYMELTEEQFWFNKAFNKAKRFASKYKTWVDSEVREEMSLIKLHSM